MTTNDRTEYEAFYRMERLTKNVGGRTLEAIIRAWLSACEDDVARAPPASPANRLRSKI